MVPLIRDLREIQKLRNEISQALLNRDIPRNVEHLLQSKKDEAEALSTSIEELKSRVTSLEPMCTVNPEDEQLLEHATAIEELAQQGAAHQQDHLRQQETSRKLATLEEGLKDRAELVLSHPLDEHIRNALNNLSIAELRGRVQVWNDARRPLEKAEDECRHAERGLEEAQAELENLPDAGTEGDLRKRVEKLHKLGAQEHLLDALKEEESQNPQGFMARYGAPFISLLLLAGAVGLALAVVLGWVTQIVLFGGIAVALASLAAAHEVLRRGSGPNAPGRIKALKKQCEKLRSELGLKPGVAVEEELEPAQDKLFSTRRRAQLINTQSARSRVLEQRKQEQSACREHQEGARLEIAAILEGIPVVKVRLERPGEELAAELEGLRQYLREIREIELDAEACGDRIASREKTAQTLSESLGENALGNSMSDAGNWFKKLRDVERERSKASQAQDERKLLLEQLEHKEGLRNDKEATLKQLLEQLGAMDTENRDPASGLRLFTEALKKETKADTLEQNLPNGWEELASEFEKLEQSGMNADLSATERISLEQEVENLEQDLLELREEKGRVRQEKASLMEQPGLDDVDGEIQALHEQQNRIREIRDRLLLLAGAIREADARYRALHQPNVLKQASSYVCSITKNRYSDLSVDTTETDSRLFVRYAHEAFPLPVDSRLSRGTREQIYLALRMAFADHIGGDTSLPLILDELFVNWDPTRTQSGLDVVRKASENRQIFMMTCHPGFADQMQHELNARIIATQPTKTPVS